MRKLGFTLARAKTIAALLAGPQYVLFEDREANESRNLLDAGELAAEEAIALLRCCRGSHDQYRETPHHRLRGVPVHVFKPVRYGVRWYIKVYFIDGTREPEPAIFNQCSRRRLVSST